MRFREIVAVALGGGLGTLSRVGALEATEHLPQGEMLATVAANTLGALGLAFVLARGLPEFPHWLRSGISVGFLGSYTTFSAIALLTVTETMAWGLGYLAVTLVAGILAVLVGRALGVAARRGGLR
ncbi:MAG: CrcB family protein [Pontimonas sp.]|nr:CrcB family protein [Pontimonas sp.]